HFLRVEIKFANDFIEMGTIQFLSVPYALYAGKSLEPGPAGPVGPPGDPATDNQRLSFDGVNLTIDNGETNPTTISTVNMGVLVNNPNDEIQDLRLTNNILSITGNPDSTNIDLSHLVNEKDKSITNEIQELNFDQENNTLTITGGNSVSLGELVAFKVNLNTTISLPSNTPYTVVFPIIIYNDGDKYNDLNGIFTATEKGNYAFYLTLNLPFQACSASISVDGNEELLIGPTSSGGEYKVYSTMRLLGTEQVSIVVRQTNGFPITTFNISGTFSGFRVF
ncbi:MAG: hypothetical protein E4G95_10030, partial [Bacteroidia bacterium]